MKALVVVLMLIVWGWFIVFGIAAAYYGMPEFFFFTLIPLAGTLFVVWLGKES